MRNSIMRKSLTAVVVAMLLTMVMSVGAFAATTKDLMKDGTLTAGFINAGELIDGTVQGPSNWTQLNLGDAAVEVPYLHIIMKGTGENLSKAQIVISDTLTTDVSTITEEYTDVVIDVSSLEMLSWTNFTGFDGGTYTIKDIFLSDDAAPTIGAVVEEEVVAEPVAEDTSVPKTGESVAVATLAVVAMAGCVAGFVGLKRKERA
ncbi:MAG: LPXTG-motif cell wall anchor domain protein [Herbinix sp.]|nr:LPXTG-motif cell wall anchor domain protein [Herbinix sp.]